MTSRIAPILAVVQAAPNSTMSVIRGRKAGTEINNRLFLPSSAIVCAVLVICCCFGLISKFVMMYTGRNILDSGSSPQQVAHLAAMQPGDQKKRTRWYLKLHPDSPHITISTDFKDKSDWEEDVVENKYKKRATPCFPWNMCSS